VRGAQIAANEDLKRRLWATCCSAPLSLFPSLVNLQSVRKINLLGHAQQATDNSLKRRLFSRSFLLLSGNFANFFANFFAKTFHQTDSRKMERRVGHFGATLFSILAVQRMRNTD